MKKKRFRWRNRIVVLATALVLALSVGAGVTAFADTSPVQTHALTGDDFAVKNEKTTSESFLIGGWVSYYPTSIRSYEEQTENMAAAGLNFNIFPYVWSTDKVYPQSKEAWQKIEDVYSENNMVYLLDDDPHARSLDDPAKHVEWAKGLTNCIGYHVCDEPHPTTYDSVVKYYKKLQSLDPSRPPFVNLLPAFAGQDYRAYITEWVDAVGAENLTYLSHDYYPFNATNTDMGIFGAMETMRSVAYENGKLRTHAFPQSSWWSGKRMPTADEMRWNAYAYVAYGFKMLTWFNLVSPGTDESGEGYKMSPIHRDGVIYDRELYADFTEINWSIRGLGDALMNLDTVHAYHTRANVAGVEALPEDYGIRPLGTEDMILSEMEAKDGSESHIMLFNKSFTESVTASYSIGEYSGINGLEWLNPVTSKYEPFDTSNRNFTVTLRPGEGKLFKVLGRLGGESAEAPSVSLESGRYYDAVKVSLTAPESMQDAEIYYTLDGTYPTANSTRYTSAIALGRETTCVDKFTLRAVASQGGRLSEVASREYFIIKFDEYNRKPYLSPESDFAARGGSWEKSGGRISTAGNSAGSYLYTAETFDCFVAEAQMHTSGLKRGSAGFTVRTSAGEDADALTVGVSENGTVQVSYNGQAHPTSFTADSFDRMSFGLKIIKLYDNVVVYVDGTEILSVYMTDADFGDAYLGVYTEEGIPLAVDSLRVLALQNERVKVLQTITSVQKQEQTVAVDLYTPWDELLPLLPTTVLCNATGSVTARANVTWSSDAYDRTVSGDQTIFGAIEIPKDSVLVNTNNVRAQCTIKVRYDLYFWEIRDLVAQVETLDPADYTAKSWKALDDVYKQAVEVMTERTQPQSIIYPLKRYLEQGIAGLVNPSLQWFALDDKLCECEALIEGDYTAESYALFAQRLDGVKALSRTGPIAQADIEARIERLDEAQGYLVPIGKTYALEQLLAVAKQVQAAPYTAVSYHKLQVAVRNAEAAILAGGTEEEFAAHETLVRNALRTLASKADKSSAGTEKSNTAGIVIGVVVGAAVLAGVGVTVWLLLRRKKKGDASVTSENSEVTK